MFGAVFRNKRKETRDSFKSDHKIYECTDLFVSTLENTLSVIDAYASKAKDWLILNISADCEKSIDSLNNYRFYYYYIEIELVVGSWYNSILYPNKKAEDYITSVYTFDSSENTFKYRILVANSTNCVLQTETTNKILFECLNVFERKNPGRMLTRTSYGVQHKWNL